VSLLERAPQAALHGVLVDQQLGLVSLFRQGSDQVLRVLGCELQLGKSALRGVVTDPDHDGDFLLGKKRLGVCWRGCCVSRSCLRREQGKRETKQNCECKGS